MKNTYVNSNVIVKTLMVIVDYISVICGIVSAYNLRLLLPFSERMYGDSKYYKLRMIADANHDLEELTATEYFFKTVNVLGLAINMAKSKKKSLGIKVDMENSYVYLENLDSNDGTSHKFRGWLEH